MEHRWNEIDRGKPKYWGKNLSQCHFVHQKCHTDWAGIAFAVVGRRLTAWAMARPWCLGNMLEKWKLHSAFSPPNMKGRKIFLRQNRRWKNNINVTKHKLFGRVWPGFICLFVANTRMNLQVTYKAQCFFTCWATDILADGSVYDTEWHGKC
jgi:hypothetical protein